MQKSPIVTWLLLAATLAVYAVVCMWAASQPFPAPVHTWVTFDALTTAQLSLFTIWCGLRPVQTVWSRMAPAAAVVVATMLVAAVIRDPVPFWSKFWEYLPGYGLHVALLLVALWMLQRTEFWRRRFGSRAEWQFSMAQLLVMMTVVAVLTASLRSSPFFGTESWLPFACVIANVAVAVASVIAWSAGVPWGIRLAAALGFASLAGIALGLPPNVAPVIAVVLGADLLLQAVVLSIWIGSGAILPHAVASMAAVAAPPDSQA